MRRLVPSLVLVALALAPLLALASGGAVIVRADTLERAALDPWVTLADGSVLRLGAVDLALSATAHEPRFLVIGDVVSGRTRELPGPARKVSFQSLDGTRRALDDWIAPHGSLAFWPGASEAGDPADADLLVVVPPGGDAFEVRRPPPKPVPEPGVARLLVPGAVLLVAIGRRSGRRRVTDADRGGAARRAQSCSGSSPSSGSGSRVGARSARSRRVQIP